MEGSGSLVPPRSIIDIRANTTHLRVILGLNDAPYFPVVKVFEFMQDWEQGYELEIIPDHLMQEEGLTTGKVIRLKESVYNGAAQEIGRDRFTFAHELGHAMLHDGVQLTFARSRKPLKAYEDSEWQANTFAAELLMPYEFVKLCGMPSLVEERCKVSNEAATLRWEKVHGLKVHGLNEKRTRFQGPSS